LGGRKRVWPVKTEWWVAGMVICMERGADLHMAQLMPLPLTVSCFSKIQIGLTFLVPAHLGSPGKKAVIRVCVCVLLVVFITAYYWSLVGWQFGESQKLRLVRILRSTVMVRVGGGWVALDEFLVKNDPCRGISLHCIALSAEFYNYCKITDYSDTVMRMLQMHFICQSYQSQEIQYSY